MCSVLRYSHGPNRLPSDMPRPAEMSMAAAEHGATDHALDQAIQESADWDRMIERQRSERSDRKQYLLSRAKEIVPAHVGRGTSLADDLWSEGGECRELRSLATMDEIRQAVWDN